MPTAPPPLGLPFVEEDDYFFLKTVIPSRKATRDYLDQGEPDAEN
ncbi:MAG TPA: hypothetical protein PKC22_16120 [Rhodocyclaceae bacterium]|nr:hypothetical protein [Rhodocyclaceae bacterium]